MPDLVARVGDYMERIVITVKGKPMAILVNAEELESLEETTGVLAIPEAREDIMEGLKQAKRGIHSAFETKMII